MVSQRDFEDTAVRLAADALRCRAPGWRAAGGRPSLLSLLRRRLVANLLVYPAYDTRRSAQNMERAYAAMHERHALGLPPAHIVVNVKARLNCFVPPAKYGDASVWGSFF